jgi:hypothetical protein
VIREVVANLREASSGEGLRSNLEQVISTLEQAADLYDPDRAGGPDRTRGFQLVNQAEGELRVKLGRVQPPPFASTGLMYAALDAARRLDREILR